MSAPKLDAGEARRFSPLVERIGGKGAEAWAVHGEAMARAAGGDNVIALSVGDPDFDTPRPIVEAAVAELRAGNTHYTDFAGGEAYVAGTYFSELFAHEMCKRYRDMHHFSTVEARTD